jgi:PmbA protein
MSFLAGKLGKKVASEEFTLIDDGTHPNGLNSRKFDDEGAPVRKNKIIKKGILRTYLHNTSTAKKFGKKTTGNAGIIAPHPWNAVVASGNKSREELFGEVDEGIYITNVWYTRFQNYQRGDFSTIPRDGTFLIKDGEIEHPIKNIRISDNLLRLCDNLISLSAERQWIYWWEVGTPSLLPYALVKDVNITKPL